MPIVESRIDRIDPQGPGRIRVFEYFRDHTGFETTNIYDVHEGYDTALHLSDAVIFRDAHAIESEAEVVEARVLEDVEPDTITIAHITEDQKLIAIIMALMKGRAQQVFRAAQWIDDNISNGQLNALVGSDRARLILDRITGLLALRTDLETDEGLRDG